jgi:hypothetical protein
VAAASAAATTGPTGAVRIYHPHKGHLLKSEVHSEVQRLALHASGGFLSWARGMHKLAAAVAPPAKNPAPKPQAAAPAPSAPMVPHEATLRMGAFSLVADRLEDWEEDAEEQLQTLGLSGSGADTSRMAHPHARYEVHVKGIVASSTAAAPPTAAGGAQRRGAGGQQHHLRPFFRRRSGSGAGVGVAIPSSSDDEDEAESTHSEEGRRPVLLHKYVWMAGWLHPNA